MELESLTREELINRVAALEKFSRESAEEADFDNTKVPFHFKFRPDDPVLDLMPHDLDGYDGRGGVPAVTEDSDLSYNLDGDGPVHRLLIGDNFHALTGLSLAAVENGNAMGCYDLIYIDPPYNTGDDDTVYNGEFAKTTDPWFHTDWESFIYSRLGLAHKVLSPEGVIMVAIGMSELHRLRMLMDHVFGRNNFISQVTWKSGRHNGAKLVSNSGDFMLVYAKNRSRLKALKVEWRDVDEVTSSAYFAAAASVWESLSGVSDVKLRVESARKKFASVARKDFAEACEPLRKFNRFSDDGRLYSAEGDISFNGGGGYVYDVIHPVTNEVVSLPSRGYVCPEDTMRSWIDEGLIEFGKDHTTQLNKRRFEYTGSPPESVIMQNGGAAGKHMTAIMGKDVFKHPKDHRILARWFRTVAPKNAKILDFFGGSGSTAEAVLYLNQQDGGTREVTIVTDDFEDVGTRIARERIVRVMSGKGWADGKSHEGYGGRLAVFRVGANVSSLNPYDETEYQSWSRDAGLWSVFLESPVVVEDTGKFLVMTSPDGSKTSVIGYSTQITHEDANSIEEKYPYSEWLMIHTSRDTCGGAYPYTAPRGDVTVIKLPHDQQKIVRDVARSAVSERAKLSHTERLDNLLNKLTDPNGELI
ncbi:MAG: site-specific DNA-methyltransferase [Spirochaetes bacterium]|nr:MAG: site-specific DNA-methyltransferase [Spirochaetota bacterium]